MVGRRGRPLGKVRPTPPHPPSVALRVAMVGGLAIVLLFVILFRLWFLQILSGSQYVALANNNRVRTVKIVAPRGSILARNGAVLVDNRPALDIGIRPMDVPAGQLGALARRLSPVIGVPAKAIVRRVQQNMWLPYDLVIVKRDASMTMVAYVLERTDSFPGVEIQHDYLRAYPQGDLAAHILGYLGEISPQQLKQARYKGYSAGDEIGQSGVEYTYDRWLRGVDGSLKVEVDAFGRPRGQLPGGHLPQPGDNVVLTIDSGVQRATEQALKYGISLAHQNGFPQANAGAAVVLDAHTGGVVAMASYPTYDPAWFAGGISAAHYRALTAPQADNPLLNRAIAGQYPCGSTFKVVDTVAALEEGVITPSTTLYCPGVYVNHGLVFHDWNPAGHGTIDVTQALVQSADTFFYQIGYDFYLRKGTVLEDWARQLGFGHVTGIDIPGEAAGLVPTPAWRRRTYTNPVDKLWKPGNSINLAIGQGDLEVTPLQLAVTYAAIANGGYIVRPHLGYSIETPQGTVLERIPTPPQHKLAVSPSYLALIRHALRLAASTPAGTSYGVFGNYPLAVAGKTGTAQVFGKEDYSWYASFAPADNPQYVVVVLIEQGGHGGTAAAPAARLIYDALFHVKGNTVGGIGHGD